jgi:hypothetical protein
MIWQGDEGEENVFMMKGGYEKSDEIIAQIEASSFTGDTLIQSGDNKVRIRKKTEPWRCSSSLAASLITLKRKRA